MRHLRSAAVIGSTTVLEAVRNRLLLVAVLFGVVLIGVSVAAASVSISERARLIIDVGMAAASGLGSLIAVALTVTSFAGEIDKHTAYPVLARPLPRWVFILGKYLGVLATMIMVVTIMVVATATTVWLYGAPVPGALWTGLALAVFELALVVAVALMFSTLSVPSLAAAYAVGLVVAGNLANDMQQIAQKQLSEGKLTGHLLELAYYVVPDLSTLSVRLQAANNLPVSPGFLGAGALYATLYAATALVIAMLVFSRRRAI
jgi:ABC-type transport system involved in multi-copper enzyme maturation permease subunit